MDNSKVSAPFATATNAPLTRIYVNVMTAGPAVTFLDLQDQFASGTSQPTIADSTAATYTISNGGNGDAHIAINTPCPLAPAEVSLSLPLAPGQITSPMFGKDVWTSGPLTFVPPPGGYGPGDLLKLNITLTGGCLTVTDTGFFNTDESIYFFIGGSGGVGGGLVHDLVYSWTFTGVTGTLPINPILGVGVLGGISGNGLINLTNVRRDLELTNGSFTFCDIHLAVLVPATIGANWAPTFVNVSVDGDSVSIAPPPPPPSARQVQVFPGTAPDRGTNAAGEPFLSTVCPPGVLTADGQAIKEKAIAGAASAGKKGGAPQDKDVNNDNKKDYFMGEWQFIQVQDDKDLVVRKWCIDDGLPFFTLEILTSSRDPATGKFIETQRLPPGDVT
jgi:hypothetical protein